MLLHCPMVIVCPLYDISGKGLPVAIKARPSVQAIRSAGAASLLEVGLEIGKIIGRSTCLAIARTMASVKTPGLGRRTDQDRRVYLRHHLLQPNLLWT